MKRLTILIVLLMIISTLAGCFIKQDDQPAQRGSGTREAAPSTPERAGAVVIGGNFDTQLEMPDPVLEGGNANRILPLAFEGLVKAGNGSPDIQPLLAESWTISKDGTVYRFKLKPGVMFSDGTPVTAEDWLWSLERARSLAESPWQNYTLPIATVAAPDESTLEIRLKGLCAPFLSMLCLQNFSVVKRQQENPDTDNQSIDNLVGTGPFYFESWHPGESFNMKRNPYYHAKIATNADLLRFNVIPDDNIRAERLKSGEIDICTGLPPNRAAEFKHDDGFAVNIYPSAQQSYVNFNVTKSPFDNKDVRRALRMATDGREIVKIIYFDCGEPVYNPFRVGCMFYDKNLPDEGYDIDKAKKLLTEAGYPNGFETEISYVSGRPTAESAAALLKLQWAKIGVTLSLNPVESTQLSAQIASLEHSAAILRWSEDTDDPASFADFIALYDQSNGFYTGYQNDMLTGFADEAAGTMDAEKRKSAYYSMQQILYDDAPVFPLWNVPFVLASRNGVTGFTQASTGYFDVNDLKIEP